MESKNIAIAGEITPSKTIIPIIEKLREYEKEDKLNFKINKIIGLYHGESSKSFLEPYCDELYSIGEEAQKTLQGNWLTLSQRIS